MYLPSTPSASISTDLSIAVSEPVASNRTFLCSCGVDVGDMVVDLVAKLSSSRQV